ncbi:MAG: hypothetical protein AB7D36_05500 [Oscillospiraceae bacterium]
MEIIRERQPMTNVWYEREFTDKPHCGMGFPCDENGNVDVTSLNDAAAANYQDCINGKYPHFIDRGAVKITQHYTAPAVGKCSHCGREVELVDEYCGACQCECGQWYNMMGQELRPPEQWEEPIDYDY